ncbi:hypothetical protein B0A55_07181 [Friedmanniomyces simplex]|uniref:Uncharacterized protein n=1 Tax=Friedmanniomyces simplex TaxID=329884 RepID=A0A4U0XEK7_9PEZI|nr:hypothetical protein B0A55_07181 [Friedmanniomyces simplex]
MRDRRNTILSVSSMSSTGSTHSGRSSLSEKFSLSPPASPTLPPPVTKENRRRTRYSRLTLVKLLASIAASLLLLRVVLCWPRPAIGSSNTQLLPDEIFADTRASPSEPAAVIVPDASGRPKWTVSIPQNSSSPLDDKQYADICSAGEVLREKLVQKSRIGRFVDVRRRTGYYTKDWTYLDVSEAERSRASTIPSRYNTSKVCTTSLTFALDPNEASFGKSLLMLWLSYGLAKHEGRAFFVDDTRWAYGRYTSYFATIPDQGCAPPPKYHIVPCPHQAKHLLVSAATAQWTFGALFERQFTPKRNGHGKRYKRIFALVRRGYEDLFALVGDDAAYAQARIADLRNEVAAHAGSVVGMHIRRGDLHPHERQYSGDYLPLERYAAEAKSLLLSKQSDRGSGNNTTTNDRYESALDEEHSSLLLASDDPDILTSSSLAHAISPLPVQRAQGRIQLATKATLDRTSPVSALREPGSAYVKHVDENSGWEGGFFSALFYSLGNSQESTLKRLSQLPGSASVVSEQAMRMRELVGRAYLLDLAVLGESDGVVCAVSSAACRVLGVMMGWEAVREGRWVNVDDGRPWSWDGGR